MAQKPSIPKGTRDFGQVEMARRNYIFDTIKGVFSLYGFQQIETPAMENIGTLMTHICDSVTHICDSVHSLKHASIVDSSVLLLLIIYY